MPTRILSFQQLCLEADPDYQRDATKPWIYRWSNGRTFYREPNPYPVFPELATIGPLPAMEAGTFATVPYTLENLPNGVTATIEFWTAP